MINTLDRESHATAQCVRRQWDPAWTICMIMYIVDMKSSCFIFKQSTHTLTHICTKLLHIYYSLSIVPDNGILLCAKPS